MPDSSLMDVKQAAEYLNTSVTHIRQLWGQRELAAVKIGGKVRFHRDDLDKYIEERRTEAVR